MRRATSDPWPRHPDATDEELIQIARENGALGAKLVMPAVTVVYLLIWLSGLKQKLSSTQRE